MSARISEVFSIRPVNPVPNSDAARFDQKTRPDKCVGHQRPCFPMKKWWMFEVSISKDEATSDFEKDVFVSWATRLLRGFVKSRISSKFWVNSGLVQAPPSHFAFLKKTKNWRQSTSAFANLTRFFCLQTLAPGFLGFALSASDSDDGSASFPRPFCPTISCSWILSLPNFNLWKRQFWQLCRPRKSNLPNLPFFVFISFKKPENMFGVLCLIFDNSPQNNQSCFAIPLLTPRDQS